MTETLTAQTRVNVEREQRARKRDRLEDLLTTFAWLLIVFPVAVYFQIYGFSGFTSLRGVIEAFGIVAGLSGTGMILIMLLLASRVPLIERTYGQDKIIALHGRLGKPAFYLIIAHVLLLTLAYSISDKIAFTTETSLLFTSSGDMVQAYVSTGLLVALVASSLVLVRKRIPYEAWHIVHLISYAMVITALPHQLSTSTIFTANSWQLIYWEIMYWGTLALLTLYRFILPLAKSMRFAPYIASIKQESVDVYSMEIAGRNLQELKVHGGQFMVFRFLTKATILQAHPFSLSRIPNSENFRVTFKTLGKGTRRLSRLPAGTRIFIEGPYGAFTRHFKRNRDTLLIGAGIGITPILSLLEHATSTELGRTTVLFRAADTARIYHLPEFQQLAQAKSFSLYQSVGPRSSEVDSWLSGEHAAQGVSIRNYLHDPLTTDLFICGEESWMDRVTEDAINAGVPRASIHMERFTL